MAFRLAGLVDKELGVSPPDTVAGWLNAILGPEEEEEEEEEEDDGDEEEENEEE